GRLNKKGKPGQTFQLKISHHWSSGGGHFSGAPRSGYRCDLPSVRAADVRTDRRSILLLNHG
ncbi:hypothetical protein, partial [Acidomonas methanolica]|uniref:hypothetical protein n=1 Tax=Acidomonas methanolica TaxID=437 RepID=UPI001C03EE00